MHLCVQFMELEDPLEEFILVLDSDMLIRKPFLPADFGVSRGRAASENMVAAPLSPAHHSGVCFLSKSLLLESKIGKLSVSPVLLQWYLEDLNEMLAPKLLADAQAKHDWDAFPRQGRLADEVGEFYFLHRQAGGALPGSRPPVFMPITLLNLLKMYLWCRDDLRKVAPLWWEFTLPVLRTILHNRAPEVCSYFSRTARLQMPYVHCFVSTSV